MPDDGSRYELIRGEVKKMTPAGGKHGAIVVNLTLPLGSFVKSRQLGVVFGAETGFKILSNPDTVRAPDIAFIRTDRIPSSGIPDSFWEGAPDLAVEVLSPRDTIRDVEEKVADWLSAGVKLVWVIDPKQRVVHVHRPGSKSLTLTERDVLDGKGVVPGFRCGIAEILA